MKKQNLIEEFEKYLMPFVAGFVAYYFALEAVLLKSPLTDEIKQNLKSPSSLLIFFGIIILILLITFTISFLMNRKEKTK
jgi:predicted PurR-regulated permease PerM